LFPSSLSEEEFEGILVSKAVAMNLNKSVDDPTRVLWSDFQEFIERQPQEDQDNPDIDYDIRISFHTNAEGKKVKRTEYIKITKTTVSIPRTVYERQQRMRQNKFGLAANDVADSNVTMLDEEIYITPVAHGVRQNKANIQNMQPSQSSKQETPDTAKKLLDQNAQDGRITCRNCGGPHWTRACTSKIVEKTSENPNFKDSQGEEEEGKQGKLVNNRSQEGKYKPPGARQGNSSHNQNSSDEHEYKLRLNNLSDEINEDDLYELLRSLELGHVSRINIIRDHNTRASRGFAFIIFYKKESVANAITKLNGYRFNHMVLQAEQAKART